jgi:GTPase SAR1 family protein
MYYKDINGVLLVFDLTDEESFKNISFWLSDIKKHGPEKVTLVLVGNKCDLV